MQTRTRGYATEPSPRFAGGSMRRTSALSARRRCSMSDEPPLALASNSSAVIWSAARMAARFVSITAPACQHAAESRGRDARRPRACARGGLAADRVLLAEDRRPERVLLGAHHGSAPRLRCLLPEEPDAIEHLLGRAPSAARAASRGPAFSCSSSRSRCSERRAAADARAWPRASSSRSCDSAPSARRRNPRARRRDAARAARARGTRVISGRSLSDIQLLVQRRENPGCAVPRFPCRVECASDGGRSTARRACGDPASTPAPLY